MWVVQAGTTKLIYDHFGSENILVVHLQKRYSEPAARWLCEQDRRLRLCGRGFLVHAVRYDTKTNAVIFLSDKANVLGPNPELKTRYTKNVQWAQKNCKRLLAEWHFPVERNRSKTVDKACGRFKLAFSTAVPTTVIRIETELQVPGQLYVGSIRLC